MRGWRRISDWKRELVLVRLEDVDPTLIAERSWVLPADRIAASHPRLAALSREGGVARVEAREAKLLRARGVTLHELGYHRGSDGFGYRRTGAAPAAYSGVASELVPEVLGEEADDEVYDGARSCIPVRRRCG